MSLNESNSYSEGNKIGIDFLILLLFGVMFDAGITFSRVSFPFLPLFRLFTPVS